MSCCGQNRQRASASATTVATATATVGAGRAGAFVSRHRPTLRPLEYIGTTGLTVLGPATGRRYRFAAPGVRLAVDPRDWAGLARLAVLRPA